MTVKFSEPREDILATGRSTIRDVKFTTFYLMTGIYTAWLVGYKSKGIDPCPPIRVFMWRKNQCVVSIQAAEWHAEAAPGVWSMEVYVAIARVYLWRL